MRGLGMAAIGAALLLAGPAPAQRSPIPPLKPLTMTAVAGTRQFVTVHQGIFNGKRVRYRATVGETIVRLADQHPVASLFSFAYEAMDGGDPARRPVIFIFNGGPGGASAPLHLSSIGPKILARVDTASFADPTVPLIDNPASPLDVADLVFIDPTDTGFSRTLPGAPPGLFHSVDGDSEAVAQLIACWLRDHRRTASPLYLFGESYGSMRAVALARDLVRLPEKIVVDGVMLGGPAITYGQAGNLPNPGRKANELVMMASVAWHYGKIDNKGQSWTAAVEKARHFARGDYLHALELGFTLDDATRERIVRQLPRIIGIPERYFRENHTILVANFNAELLRDEGLVLDRNTGLEAKPAKPDSAAGGEGLSGLDHAMMVYSAGDLKATGLGPYTTLTPDTAFVTRDWDFTTAGAPALDVVLSRTMKEHPAMRLLITQGRYDTLTQMGITEYTMMQTDLPRDRVTTVYYDGGHFLTATPEAMAGLRTFVGAPTSRIRQ